MIPAGIFNQGGLDLDTEIWVSFGDGYSQGGGRYVNAIPVTHDQTINLLNGRGQETGFSVHVTNFSGGINPSQSPTGVLDIINRTTATFSSGNGVLTLFDALDRTVDIYTLGGRMTSLGQMVVDWVIGQNNLPNEASPVQTKLELNEDWTRTENVTRFTTSLAQIRQANPEFHANFRAFVIKILD